MICLISVVERIDSDVNLEDGNINPNGLQYSLGSMFPEHQLTKCIFWHACQTLFMNCFLPMTTTAHLAQSLQRSNLYQILTQPWMQRNPHSISMTFKFDQLHGHSKAKIGLEF